MKIPIDLVCDDCRKQQIVYTKLNDTSSDLICECGNDLSFTFDFTMTTGIKLLLRCDFEIREKKDYPLSIVFAAASMDCELSRLFFKHRKVEGLQRIDDKTLEDELRKLGPMDKKIRKVTDLFYQGGITEFVKNNTEVKTHIEEQFPCLDIKNLPKSFQEKLFWPRNKILHSGKTNHDKDDAIKCFEIAQVGIYILREMDKEWRGNN